MAERDLVVRIIGDEKDLLRALRKSERETQQFSVSMGRATKGFARGLGFAGLAGGIAGVGLAIRSTVGAAVDFEDSFAGVRKTVSASEPQLEKLAGGFRQMSKDIPVSVDELNSIGEAAGQLGIQTNAILGFTKVVAELGVTTDLTSDQAADALARIANITQLPQDQFDRLGSTLVDLGNKLAATESEIVDMSLRLAGAGHQIGLTEDEILSFAGALASVGVNAEAGGTAFSRVFATIASSVADGGKKLQSFASIAGESAAEFGKHFERDAAGAITQFVEGLGKVKGAGGNVFAVLKDLGLGEVRVRDALLRLAGGGDILRKSLEVGEKAWKRNNALQIEAQKRFDTTASKLKIFQNRVQDLQITLGTALLPVLERIVTPLSDWLEKTENQERLLGFLNDTINTVAGTAEALRGAFEHLNSITGSTKNSLKLLFGVLVAYKGLKIVGTLAGIATNLGLIGTEAGGSIGKVKGLRTQLLLLRRIGIITIGVELIFGQEGKGIKGFLEEHTGLDFDKGLLQNAIEDAGSELETTARKQGGQTFKEFQNTLEGIFPGIVEAGAAAATPTSKDKAKTKKAVDANAAFWKKFWNEYQKSVTGGDGAGSGGGGMTAAEKQRAKFDQLIDSLQLDLERAGATKTFRDNLRALDKLEQAVLAQIKVEGKTTELMRQLFQIRQERADTLRQQSEQQAQQIEEKQFLALGLTKEGQKRLPGKGALLRRLGTLRDQIKGTVLDTAKTRAQLQKIENVLRSATKKLSAGVVQAILDMYGDISGALEGGGGGAQGPITKFAQRGVKQIIDGLGLTAEQAKALEQRMSGVGASGVATGGRLPGAAGPIPHGAGRGDVIVHGDLIVQDVRDPDDLVKKAQRKAGRSAGSRRGVRPGTKTGLA